MLALSAPHQGGWKGALSLTIGHIIASFEMALILTGLGVRAEIAGIWRTTVANGIGMLLLISLVFSYYISYDLNVPYESETIPQIAAGMLIPCAVGAALLLPKAKRAAFDWTPVWVAIVLLVLPFRLWAAWQEPKHIEGEGWPVRVMTYNLHQGFDINGWLGMEELANVIEGSGAEVVALQEVSRGWYINGSLDMLVWLSQRLNMPYIFGPAADRLWGNAILSRYPFIEHGNIELPRGGVPMKRGFLWALIDLGKGERTLIIATHLHHVKAESHVRIPQAKAIVDFWEGRERTIILGDLNAEPETEEIAVFLNAGLLDAFLEVGVGDGYTFPSRAPRRRIDYILVSPDLTLSDFFIPLSTASDHLGIAVTVGR
jgi:endonuclease/exonuclease/phosphatase family metal-dependent hydrolase